MLLSHKASRIIRIICFGVLFTAVTWYFVAEYLVASQWSAPGYSYLHNYVSDLGVPECSTINRFVCSPWHELMNASFVLLGTALLLGIIALASLYRGAMRIVLVVMGSVSSIGIMLVGFAPGSFAENITGCTVQMFLHSLGALLGVGGIAIIAIIVGISLLKNTRACAAISLFLGMTPFVIFAAQAITGIENLGLGRGGFERIGVYAVFIWLVLMSLLGFILQIHSRKSISN